jgi:FlaA1/EpsC-like NDP-sugar epimerase
LPELAADLRGRRVLITGAAGSIGSELARQVALHCPATLVLFDQAETDLFYIGMELREKHPDLALVQVIGDIVDPAAVERVFQVHQPERVYHAAAYKHVPMMECNQREAILNNVIGTWRVADAAGRHSVNKFVLVSTDKAVQPVSVMGATKRLAELVVLELQERYLGTTYAAVRFGNVLGSNGSVLPIFKRQLESGKPLTVTDPEATRYFMTIQEAVQLILQASLLPEMRGSIAMLEMGEPVRIEDLAKNLLHLAGLDDSHGGRIVYTGLRPGERLHEQLLAPDEQTTPTAIPKVRLVFANGDFGGAVCQGIEGWERAFRNGAGNEVLVSLKTLFPGLDGSDPAAHEAPTPEVS